MDSNSSNPSPAEVSKIAAMREILFGENINQYQKEFELPSHSLEQNIKVNEVGGGRSEWVACCSSPKGRQ